MPSAAVTPLAGSRYQSRFAGVLIDVPEGDGELPDTITNPGMKSFTPEMHGETRHFAVSPSEIAQKPIHDRREAFSSSRLDLEMDVVSHHTKVSDLDAVALFGAREEHAKKITNLAAIEKHFSSGDTGRDVVPRAI
jgi:hypothetical protein